MDTRFLLALVLVFASSRRQSVPVLLLPIANKGIDETGRSLAGGRDEKERERKIDGSRETRIDLRRLVVRLPGYYGDYTATPGHDDTGRLSARSIRRHVYDDTALIRACLLALACRLPPLPAYTPSPSNSATPTAQPRSDVRDAAILLSPSGFSSNERHVVAQIIDCSRTLDVVGLENTLRIHGKPVYCLYVFATVDCAPETNDVALCSIKFRDYFDSRFVQ